MLVNQRHKVIIELLRANGAVDVASLVSRFGVSIETVRKDLLAMERQGLLKRVHGGALGMNQMEQYAGLQVRNTFNNAAKQELAALAVSQVQEGMTIGIDSGSTAAYFARELRAHFHKLTVVTHSRDVFDILCDMPDYQIILCGGKYLSQENSFCGNFVLDMLQHIRVQKAFLCPSAISLQHGAFDFQEDLYQVQKALLAAAEEIVVLADSSKYEKIGLLKILDMREDYTFITDSGLSAELKQMYIKNGIHLLN